MTGNLSAKLAVGHLAFYQQRKRPPSGAHRKRLSHTHIRPIGVLTTNSYVSDTRSHYSY
jgi:hypothetical protein